MGIVACPTPRTGLEIVPFSVETMVLICAPEHLFAQQSEIALRELEGQPFIAFDDDIPTRALIDDKLRERGVKVKIITSYDNIETLKNMVEIGSGIALVPAGTVRQEAREGQIAVVPLVAADSFQRPAGLLVKSSKVRRAAVRAFVNTMRLTEAAPTNTD